MLLKFGVNMCGILFLLYSSFLLFTERSKLLGGDFPYFRSGFPLFPFIEDIVFITQ